MELELYTYINKTKWILTDSVSDLKVTQSLYDSPGKCTFTIHDNFDIPNGSTVHLKVDGKGFFKGYVFKTSFNQDDETEVTAYDQMRYLKNEDTIYYKNKSASDIFADICKRNGLKYDVVWKATYKNLPYLYDKKSMFDILKTAIDENFRNTGNRYFVRDEYGTLKFINLAKRKTDLIVGVDSICTEFSYEKSIDDNTYNVIKLYRDNKKTAKRDVWQAQDSGTIKTWGRLQKTDTVDENASESQIKELAKNMLKVLNRETRSLSVSTIGFYNLRAGDGIKVELPMVNEWFYINEITTSFENNYAQSDIDLYIPNGGEE